MTIGKKGMLIPLIVLNVVNIRLVNIVAKWVKLQISLFFAL